MWPIFDQQYLNVLMLPALIPSPPLPLAVSRMQALHFTPYHVAARLPAGAAALLAAPRVPVVDLVGEAQPGPRQMAAAAALARAQVAAPVAAAEQAAVQEPEQAAAAALQAGATAAELRALAAALERAAAHAAQG